MSRADLNDYVFFAEVVAHGGFAAAGRALHQPKSKLSRRSRPWRRAWASA